MPYFGTGRWLLPFVLLLSGWYLEWGPGKEPGAPWGRTLLGIGMAYVGVLGLMQLIHFSGEFTGGRIGRFSVNALEPALTTPGAFVILVGITIAGLLIAFDMPLRALLSPATRAARAAGTTLQDRTTRAPDASGPGDAKGVDPKAAAAAGVGVMAADTGRRGRNPKLAPGEAPGQTGVWGGEPDAGAPYGLQSPAPTSATIAPLRSPVGVGAATAVATTTAAAVRPAPATQRGRRPRGRHRRIGLAGPPRRHRLGAAAQGAARPERAADGRRGRQRGRGPRVERGTDHREAQELRHRRPDHRPQRRPSGHPVRGDARAAHQGQPDRGAVRRPLDGPGRAEHPDRGADPGQERGRHRGAQQGVQRRRPAADPRRGRLRGLGLHAHVRARARRGRQGDGGRPRQDAPPADRGRHGLGQERDGQRADHEPAVQRHPRRHADDPDGPQAGRAGGLQRPAPPAGPGDHRARAGQGRAQVGGPRDGEPLPPVRRARPRATSAPSTTAGSIPPTGCRTSSS